MKFKVGNIVQLNKKYKYINDFDIGKIERIAPDGTYFIEGGFYPEEILELKKEFTFEDKKYKVENHKAVEINKIKHRKQDDKYFKELKMINKTIIIEKWSNSNIPYAVYIGEKYFEDLSKEMLIGLIIKQLK